LQLLAKARKGIYDFLLRCKVASPKGGDIGGFRVSRDGEVDTRGAYTVLSVASLLHLQTPALTAGVLEWLVTCQTYEGGLGGEPGNEAHGGYTFCGLAAATLLGSPHRLNLAALTKWAANRQMVREGGFQGRTNKLVDGCYSFWVGALFPIVDRIQNVKQALQADELHQLFDETAAAADAVASASSSAASATASSAACPSPVAEQDVSSLDSTLFDSLSLQRYILVGCQAAMGGLRDKPGKYPDLYHTCYCLSGLSIAQHADSLQRVPLLGRQENLLANVHPLYNIRHAHVERVRRAFAADKIE
jgi:protein farnesyltransferase subunit beta